MHHYYQIREHTVEIIESGKRIALHNLSKNKYKHTTDKSHMPPSHQAMQEWNPSRLIAWGKTIGPETKKQIENLLISRDHPEQGYRACLGLLSLSKKFGQERLEAACKRANHLEIVSLRRVKSILETEMDKLPLFESTNSKEIEKVLHSNIRGAGYYKH